MIAAGMGFVSSGAAGSGVIVGVGVKGTAGSGVTVLAMSTSGVNVGSKSTCSVTSVGGGDITVGDEQLAIVSMRIKMPTCLCRKM